MTKIIPHNGQSIYINWGLTIPDPNSSSDLEEVYTEKGKISNAYFFSYLNKYFNEKGMKKSKFKISKLEKREISLALEIDTGPIATMKIDGLEEIIRFFYETDANIYRVKSLIGKEVTNYGLWRCEAIGILEKNLEPNYKEKVLRKHPILHFIY